MSTLKILSLRLRGMKGQLEELGEETDENVENLSKMQGQVLNLTKGKVNIFDSAGEFRSTYEIMRDIANVWDDLNSTAQADLLETIAGKHRANSVAALLSNWQNVEAAVKSANEAEGSAARENAKYIDSIQGRLDKLTTAWQSFANTFMNSDLLKGGISTLTTFVELIEKLVDTFGSFGTIGLGAGIFGFIKNFNNIKNVFKLFSAIPPEIRSIKGLFTDLNKSVTKSISGTIGAIGLAISVISLFVNRYKEAREEISKQRQEAVETADAFLDASSSFEQAYIKYSGKTDLTADEEAELESAIKGTVDVLGDKSDALKDVVNSSNDYVASLERIADEELRVAEKSAKNKRDNAELLLEEAAMGWERWDGSEVDIELNNKDAVKIAEKIGGKYFNQKELTSDAGLTFEIQEIGLSSDADTSGIINYYNFLLDYREKLSDENLIDTSEYKDVNSAIERMSESINDYIDGVYEAAKAEYQLNEVIPKTTEEYIKMRESILDNEDVKELSVDTKKSIVDKLDSEYSSVFDISSAKAQSRKLIGVLDGYSDNEANQVETFLNMRTAVNNNECSVGDYLDELDNITSVSNKFEDREKEIFNTSFDLDTDSIEKQYKDVYKYIKRNYIDELNTTGMSIFDSYEYKKHEKGKIKDLLNSLSATELQAVANIKGEINWETINIEDIRNQIKEEAKFLEAMNYTMAIDVETESVKALNTAMAESVSGVGLSSDSIAALKDRYSELASQGYDLSTMFEETSNGIHLNKSAVNELEQALASDKLSETDGHLKVLKERYDELTQEIKNCSDAGERANLYTEQQDVAQKINDLATLAAQYEGLTSAYNAWQNAESSGNERDMYESVLEGFETVGDEISRGWYDDGTIKFLELLKGDKATIFDGKGNAKEIDIATASTSELKKVWNSLDDTIKGTSYSVKDFFTTNEDGESTSTGAYNFLRAVEELGKNGGLKALNGKNISELVERNSEGKIVAFDFDVVGGDKAVAEALGVSEEMVQIIQRTLDDAGFVVTLDGKYTLLADLKTSAEEANNSLKKLQSEGLENLKDVDLNFDFNVDTVQGYQEQLEKALNVLDKFRNEDGTLKTDKSGNLVDGAKQALEIAKYYTAAIDKLTEPKFMQIDVSTVDEELQKPLEKMKQIEDKCKEKHQVALTGDTEELEKVQGEIDKIAEELASIENEDIKKGIGIDPQWDAKTIAENIENGEIEIPAELQLDVKMSEGLKDIRLLMMKNLGLTSDGEVELKVKYNIDDSTADKLIKDGKAKIVLEFIEKNEKWFDTLTEDNKKIVIDIVANGVDLSTLNDDQKKVVVDIATKNADLWDKLSSDEQTIAIKFISENQGEEWFKKLSTGEQKLSLEIIASGVDLNALEGEEKEVVIKYIAENEDLFDKLSSEEREVAIRLLVENKDELDNLTDEQKKVYIEYVAKNEKKFNELSESDKKVFVNYIVNGGDVEKFESELKARNKNIEIIAETHGVEDVETLKSAMSGLTDEHVKVIAEAIGKGDVDALDSAVKGLDPKTVDAIARALGYDGVESLKSSMAGMDDKTVNAAAAVTGKEDVDSLNSSIDTAKAKDGTKITITTFLDTVKRVFNKVASGGKSKAAQRSGADPGGVNGTANSSGSSFAYGTIGKSYKQGDWRTKKTQTALTGELGREIVVTPQNQWYTVGDSGAEFVNIPRGSIIFNHRQTEELLKNGKATSDGGRAKALVNGTAFLHGTAFGKGTGGGEEPTTITVGVNKNTGASYTKSADSKDDFEETIDWIETSISRIERAIDQLDTKANSVYRSWSERNSNLTEQISKVGDEIALQQSAYEEYMAAANAVGLSSSYAKKVRNGTIDIETIKDEGLKDKIDDYQKWYEQALACQDVILELKETEASLYAQRFENSKTKYDGILQGYEHTEAMLNEYISQAEEQGYVVSKKYYSNLIANEKDKISELQKKQSALLDARDEAVENGKITKYSEEWYSMCAEIDSVTHSIEESTTALLEFDNAMRDIDWSIFDLIQERISDITSESEFLIELMSNKELFDDNGKFTEQGIATVGLHALNYNTSMYAADEYGKEIAKLDEQIAENPYDQELISRRRELIELQRESIIEAENQKNAIKDLVEEGINLELDALQERIDLHNEELDSMKDLYDYQKNVEKQTKNIGSLRKQLVSYENDDSEEAKAKIQELKVSLEEAESDLQETEYERFISDQTYLLDTLYTEYETILNSRLDNIDFLIEQVIDGINMAAGAEGTITSALGADGAIAAALGSGASAIGETLKAEVGNVGTKLSTAMSNIWIGDGSGKAVVDLYGKDFQTKATTTNDVLNKIKNDVAAMVDDVDKDAQKKVETPKTNTSSVTNPTNGDKSNSKNPSNPPSSSNGDGKPKVGDKVTFVSGQYYYDSQGTKPLGYHNRGKEVYITSINTKSWATHPYHISTGNKLGKGDLGWLKLNQLSGYAVGKQNFLDDEIAWTQEDGKEFIVRPSDGAILTPIAKRDSVLNAVASKNIWDMANSPTEFIRDNLGIGSTDVPNYQNVNNNITQNFESITFSMPNVHGYNDLLREMQSDPKFEKLVLSMTIDRISGRSSLAKGKSIR